MANIAIDTVQSGSTEPRVDGLEAPLRRLRALARLYRRTNARRAVICHARAEIRDDRGLVDIGLKPPKGHTFGNFMIAFLVNQQ